MAEQKIAISVLMPAFNEGRHIFANIRETQLAVAELSDSFELVVVDDGSTDNTGEEIARAAKEIPGVRALASPGNRGKGWALRKAFGVSRGELVFFLDSDLDIHPRQFSALLEIRKRASAAAVIGSKRHPDSTLNYPAARRFVSAVYFFLVKLLFGLPLRDTQTGIKLFTREALSAVLPRLLVKRYAFDLELLANLHHLGYSIAEAPIVVDYQGRFGRIGLGSIWTILLDTLAVFYRLNVLHYYDRPIPKWERTPRVSILIAFSRPNPDLAQCLEKIGELDYPDFEVILLPDREMEKPPGPVRVIPTGPVGPPDKRDLGAARATGEILAFIDDDAYPQEDWLRTAVPHFGDPSVAAVGGPASTPPEDGLREQAGGRVLAGWMVGGVHVYRHIPKMLREVDDYPTCNLLVRKSSFERAGGFDTPYWPGEDTVLCWKLTHLEKGKIIYDPDVQVFHHRRPLFRPHWRQIGNYGLHRGYFVKKFPATSRRPNYFLPSLWTLFLLLGWIPLLLVPGGITFYLVPAALYLLLALVSGAATWRWKEGALVTAGIVTTHLVYGLNFLRGLAARRLPEEKIPAGRPAG